MLPLLLRLPLVSVSHAACVLLLSLSSSASLRFYHNMCVARFYRKTHFRNHLQVHAKQGHPVAECASCQEQLVKECKQSSLVNQVKQPSSSSAGVSDLLTSVHLDMHLLSSQN